MSRVPDLDSVATPCLVVDGTTLRANIGAMAERARVAGLEMRPHSKTHKSVAIAALQREQGAAGLTVATVREAECAWQELKGAPEALDVAELGATFRAKVDRQLAAENLLEQRKELAHATARHLQELVQPLNDALGAVHPHAELNRMPDKYGQNMLSTYRSSGAPTIEFNFSRTSKISAGDPHFPVELSFGSGIELTENGDLIFHAFIHVGYTGVSGSSFRWERNPEAASVGSVEADRLLEAGIGDLQAKLREALEVFVAEAPAG